MRRSTSKLYTIPQVALAVVRVLERDLSAYLKISPVTCDQNEIHEALEKETASKWERREETTENYEEIPEDVMKSADGEEKMRGVVMRILRIAYGEDSKRDRGRGDNEMLGLRRESLRIWLRMRAWEEVDKSLIG